MKLQPNQSLSIRKIDNELFIYDRNRSLVHTFNTTGAFLWDLFEKGAEKKEMIRRVTEEYEIDNDTAEADIESFFTTLRTLNLAV